MNAEFYGNDEQDLLILHNKAVNTHAQSDTLNQLQQSEEQISEEIAQHNLPVTVHPN